MKITEQIQNHINMFSLLIAGILLLTGLAFFPHIAYAHFPSTDGNMTVTAHIDPDDNPIPGQQATLYFLFDDATNQFKLSNCTCNVVVKEKGVQILSAQILTSTHASIYGKEVPFIFPNRDVYTLIVTGTPKHVGDFQPFSVSWNFRVNQYPLGVENSFSLQEVLIPVGIALGVCIVLFGSIFLIMALTDKIKKKKVISV